MMAKTNGNKNFKAAFCSQIMGIHANIISSPQKAALGVGCADIWITHPFIGRIIVDYIDVRDVEWWCNE